LVKLIAENGGKAELLKIVSDYAGRMKKAMKDI